MRALILLLAFQVPTTWHWECVYDNYGRKQACKKVYDPVAVPLPPVVATPRPPEVVKVPPAPVVLPLPIDRQYFFGVDESHKASRERYLVGDVEVTREELRGAIDGDSPSLLPEDAGKPHLTLLARDDVTRKQLETVVASAEALPLRERYRIQVYDLSHAVDKEMVSGYRADTDARFLESGRVAIVQPASATGQAKVLGAVFAFADGKQLVEAVPKIDPGFKLPKLPGGDDRASPAGAVDPWAVVGLLCLVVLAVVVGQVVFSSKGVNQ